jgi:hypothetical protein
MLDNAKRFSRTASAIHEMEVGNYGPQAAQGESRGGPQGAREHMTATEMVNLLANDVGQLLDEVSALRARLSPLLAESDNKARLREAYPVRCELAARVGDIHLQILHARECVELTQIQLDL